MSIPVLPRLSDYLDLWAARHGDVEAAVGPDIRWTYLDLRAEVAKVKRALVAADVRAGERVAVLGLPNPRFLAVYLAVLDLGAVFQGLNPKYTEPELDHVLSDGRPSVVVDVLEPSTRSEEAAARAVHEKADVMDPFEGAADAGEPAAAPAPRDRGAIDRSPALLVYTSGTTGRPKGALLPHRGVSLCAATQADHFNLGVGSRVICNLPINHVGGLVDLTAMTIACGGTCVFQERFDPSDYLRLTETERVQFWLAVPAMLALVERCEEFDATNLSSLEHIVWSGGPISMSLGRRLQERCPSVANAFGMTETVGNVIFTEIGADLAVCCETVGRPDPRYEVIVARPDGTECDVGEEGEILVRGDFIMLEYLNHPEATARTIDKDGWLHTGDVAVRRETGDIEFHRRMSDMYKSGGYNVYPREIELALEEHPAVELACVLGVPDDLYGEVGHAFVQSKDPELTPELLRTFARERLANYKVPKTMTITPQLPRLSIGKVDKGALRQRLEGARA
jgi:acyl-CoA synthetase (AMP-forming)/AMP-acid ligase II